MYCLNYRVEEKSIVLYKRGIGEIKWVETEDMFVFHLVYP